MTGYDPHSALLVVDVQNDFADPRGSLAVPGAAEIIPAANREIAAAIRAGATVVFSQDWHPPETPHFAPFGGIWPVHCVAGSWGAEFAVGLDVHGYVVRKGTAGEDGYSAFTVRDPGTGASHGTSLQHLLGPATRRVVILGLATDYCVRATALDSLALGYGTAVFREAVRAVDLHPGDGDLALAEIEAAGGTVI